jgi:hypothetical protein
MPGAGSGERDECFVTGTDYRTAVDIHLEKLAAVTKRL